VRGYADNDTVADVLDYLQGRRFRAAKEAKELKENAERNGEKLPDEKAFDSNCITPGESWLPLVSMNID
jgi:5'-3' exoribonuclease 1